MRNLLFELIPFQILMRLNLICCLGMNPTKIGNAESDEPASNADDENSMIYQEFLLDPSLTVQQVLIDSQAEILDFARFEVGENIELGQIVDSVETCG